MSSVYIAVTKSHCKSFIVFMDLTFRTSSITTLFAFWLSLLVNLSILILKYVYGSVYGRCRYVILNSQFSCPTSLDYHHHLMYFQPHEQTEPSEMWYFYFVTYFLSHIKKKWVICYKYRYRWDVGTIDTQFYTNCRSFLTLFVNGLLTVKANITKMQWVYKIEIWYFIVGILFLWI